MSNFVIGHPVINLYSESSDESEVVSQAIYSWKVTVLDEKEGYKFIRMEDGYQGWVVANTLFSMNDTYHKRMKVVHHAAHVYEFPDVTKKKPLMTLPFESELDILSEPENDNFRWIEVLLIDGRKAWLQRGDLSSSISLERHDLIEFSQRFIGLPYTWGGVSSFGYDCSGFIQMLFRQIGVTLPRDAKDQARSDLLMPINLENIKPGDLIYYSCPEKKMKHVAFYLGEEKIIHASVRPKPLLQISPLDNVHLQQQYPYSVVRRVLKK